MHNEYAPDYIFPPGETLKDVLESLNMTQAELSLRTGRSLKTISEIVNGNTAITPETALQLERVLNVPASFWNNREKKYREFMTQIAEKEDNVCHQDI